MHFISQNGPQTQVLKFKDDMDRNISTVVVEARYIPVPVKLEARESVNSESSVFALCGHGLNNSIRSRHSSR